MAGPEAALASAASKVLFTKSAYDLLFKWGHDSSLLDTLETLVNSVKAILSDKEVIQIQKNSFVDKWFEKGRYTVYDAEDLLDMIFTDIHKEKYKLGDSPRTRDIIKEKLKYKVKDIVRTIHPFTVSREAEMSNIIKRLQFIAAQMSHLGLDKSDELTKFRDNRMSTSSDNDPFNVIGRSENVKEIIDLVNSRNGNDDGLRVIPIIGMGGVGKTTLASMVYDRYETLDQSLSQTDQSSSQSDQVFQVKGWVCVSDKFKVTDVIKSLIESVTGQDSKASENLELLHKELKRKLQGKRFLLVLDDVWSNIEDKWEILQNIFSVGAPGSKIIVTTREEKAAQTLSNCYRSYVLNGLSYEESWLLFQRHAFLNGDSSAYPSLETIGKKIVGKCKGLPLAVKMLGRLLRSKENDENEWDFVLRSKIWNSTNNILPSLWLSYYHLPLPVKQCFAYFSVFPKDYLFSMDEMVMLWIAEGFVEKPRESSSRSSDYEHMAQKYFKHLHSNFFIQQSSRRKSGFVMHDLVHDLAEYVSKELSVNLTDVNLESRRFSYVEGRNEDLLNTRLIQRLSHLRTFLGECVYDSVRLFNNKKCNDLLSNFKLLRVLSLKGYNISELPDSIGDMMLLRYLDLSETYIEYLPHWICRLFNLQVLQLSNCASLRSLPTSLCDLVNLRHLIMKNLNCEEMPDGIGRLSNLQTLSNYVIGKGKSKQMRDFKKLCNLRGQLCILGLNNVDDKEDIVTAGFGNNEHVEELLLKWEPSGLTQTILDESVLDAIQPHMSLKRLTINSYGGKRLSNWIVRDTPNFTGIICLIIINCFNCEVLPAIGNLSCLKNLIIKGLDNLESLGEEFYGDTYNAFQALQKFEIIDMKVLKTWSFPRGHSLSSLRELQIENCPILTEIPCCLPSTLKLDIWGCPFLRKRNVRTTCGHWLLR